MKWQYVELFCHLRDILHGQASGVYSFSRAIGGEMPGVLAYYLLSPFNLIIYFFSRKNIYIGIIIIALCKVGTSGLAMYTFLTRRKVGYGALLFSCAYAVNAYVVGYQFNIFWMDALIILPFMVWGIEKLVDEGRDILYICMIALAVITNFYTGYMLCIFSVLYFWCYMLLISESKCRIKVVLQYHLASLMGGMLAAGVALPTFFALHGGKANGNLKTLLSDKTVLLGYSELFRSIFCGEISNGQMTEGKPLLYGSVLAIVFAGYYFFFSKEKVKSKIAYALLFVIFAVSFKYRNLNCVWHGMQYPMGSPYRFSFLFIFLLIELAYKGFIDWEDESERKKQIYKVIYSVLLLIIFLGGYCAVGENRIWLNSILMCSYALLLIVGHKKGKPMFLCILTFELIINAGSLYLNSAAYQAATTTDEWGGYIERTSPLIEYVRKNQNFCRTVLTGDAKFSNNDGLLWNVYALESYTSLEKVTTQLLAKNMGYGNSINFGMSYGTGASNTSNALLGVQYLVSSEQYGDPYEAIYEKNGLKVWKNESAFPLAYLMDTSVLEIEPEKLSLFGYENKFLHSLSIQYDKDVFSIGTLEINHIQNAILNENEQYIKENEGEESYIEYYAKISENGCVYLRDDVSNVSKIEVIQSGETRDLSEQTGTLKKLGEMSPKDRVYIRFYLEDGESFSKESVEIAVEQIDILQTYAQMVWSQNVSVLMKKENDIIIKCTNDSKKKQYLMITIPYDTGWHAYIDGVKAEIMETNHQVLIIPVKMGTHEIEIKYVPKGLCVGALISFLTLGNLIYKIYSQKDVYLKDHMKMNIGVKLKGG